VVKHEKGISMIEKLVAHQADGSSTIQMVSLEKGPIERSKLMPQIYIRCFPLTCLLVMVFFCSMSWGTPLQEGEVLTGGLGKLRILHAKVLSETPVNKTKAKAGYHFIVVSLELEEIKPDSAFASIAFKLVDSNGNQFTEPCAWGKIAVSGEERNFEVADGAVAYVKALKEQLNLIFEVPQRIQPKHVGLHYNDKYPVESKAQPDHGDVKSGRGYGVKKISLFERGARLDQAAKRNYANVFFTASARYISVEVRLDNLLYQKEDQEFPIKLVWRDSAGQEEGTQDGLVQIKSEWDSPRYTSNGWGYADPGKWSPGVYSVDVLLDGEKVANQLFMVVEKPFEIENVQFFKYCGEMPKVDNRDYDTEFFSDATCFVAVEVGFKNLLHQIFSQQHIIQRVWYDNQGNIENTQTENLVIEDDWKSSYNTSNGWGYADPGKWVPGRYKVDISIGNFKVGEKSFEILKKGDDDQAIKSDALRGDDAIIQCTLFGMSGHKNELHMIFDKSNSGLLSKKDNEIRRLAQPSSAVNPWTAFAPDGNFVVGEEKDMKTFGTTGYKIIETPQGEKVRLYYFSRKGGGEHSMGVGIEQPSTIWAKTFDGKINRIGSVEWKKVNLDTKTMQNVLAVRSQAPKAKWTTQLGDKIFEIGDGDQLVQIGWVGWRKVTLEDNSQQVILMTKNMSPQAKWTGRFNGGLYQTD
jgi:hypothetical protein